MINGSELLDKTESYEEWLQSVINNADITYKEMYEADDNSTGANYAKVGDVEKIQCNMENSERNAND